MIYRSYGNSERIYTKKLDFTEQQVCYYNLLPEVILRHS